MDLKPLFSPSSVAVIGASREEGTVGHSIFRNILSGGFTGTVYPVNPKAPAICGVRAYRGAEDLPEPVDLAVVIVKAPLVASVLRSCGKRGVKAAVVISAGFKEVGTEGKALEEEVQAVAASHQLPLLGPNCLGLLNTDGGIRLNATFAKEMPSSGPIAFVSQSGALCTAVLEYAASESIGFSKLISMGNKAGLSELDLLAYLRDDPLTKVILLYVEDLTDGRRFIELAREVTGEGPSRKPILAIKSGRTPEGAQAASSHTGSLAGSDELYDAIFNQAGVLRVDSVEELFDYARAFAYQPLPRGGRVAIVTNAGGPGIMATDACVRYGLELARLEKSTIEAMRPHLPATASLANPVDVIGDARHDRYEAALECVLKDPNVDGVITLATPQAMTDLEEIARVVARMAAASEKPMVACLMGVTDLSSGIRVLEKSQVPHYRFPEAAVRALAHMSRYRQWITRPRTQVKHFDVDSSRARSVIQQAKAQGRLFLDQSESLEVLQAYGFPLPAFARARSAEEAKARAREMGFPVAMKILSADIVHKFDVGGVRLAIQSPEEAGRVFREILETVSRHCPQATLEGVLIQQMAPKGIELILGLKRDKQFGPVVMFGLGGITVEVLRDVTFRLAPVRELSARHMIESIRAHKILAGFRGQPPADTASLIECICRLSQLALEQEAVVELDINPLMAYPEGQGCRAADARILLA